METQTIKKIISDSTSNMFSESFYESLSQKIMDAMIKPEKNGYVYFIRIRESLKCKIGYTKNIIDRMKSFKTSLGNDFYLDGFIYLKDFIELESLIHKKLNEKRLHGEWFSLKFEEVEDIIKENNGVIIQAEIDNKLIIEDGVVINYKSTELAKIPNLFDYIYNWMNDNNYVFIEVTIKELIHLVFKNIKIESTSLRKELKKKYKPSKNKRYTSIIDNSSKVGITYTIHNINISAE
jgi:hypothetical protein